MAISEQLRAVETTVERAPCVAPPTELSEGPNLRRRLMVGDVVAASIGWGAAVGLSGASPHNVALDLVLILLAVVATLGALHWQQLYRARVSAHRSDEIARVGRAACMVVVAALAGAGLLGLQLHAPAVILGGAASFVAVAHQRGRFRHWVRSQRAEGLFGRRVLVVGGTAEAAALIDTLNDWPELGFVPVGYAGRRDPDIEPPTLPWVGGTEQIVEKVKAREACGVVIAANAVSSIELNRMVRDLHVHQIHVHLSSGISGVHHRRMRVQPIGYEPLIYVEPMSLSSVQAVAKRLLDIVISALGLLLTTPILLAAAIAVKLGDGGPVLFRQQRVGHRGEPFTMFKFRSMSVDAEDRLLDLREHNERDGPLFKLTDDPRVTRVGKVLRATSIDELPQLFNVLNGSMSLVGPRPALPTEVGQFSHASARHAVKPGITGLWQVEARDKASFAVYERLDLFYVENWSVWLDVAILLRTGRVVLRQARCASSAAHHPSTSPAGVATSVASTSQ